MEQGSPEWLAARAGKFSGSRFASVMARIRNGSPAAAYHNLIAELAVERIIGTCVETYCNAAMQRGLDLEPEARRAYEDRNLCAVDEVAFIRHPEYDFVSCSPDGMVDSSGMVEIKCPAAAAKHLDALLKGSHAVEYKWQLQGQLWVAQREWVDAVSYDPRYPEGAQLAIKRIERDEAAIKDLEAACIEANERVQEAVEQIRGVVELEKAA
jgi:putative phage-type endonuclease